MFYKIDNVWTNDAQYIDTILFNFIQSLNIRIKNGKNSRSYSRTIAGAKGIIYGILKKVQSKKYPISLYKKFHLTTKGRLCFLDGVLCVKSQRFYKWTEGIPFEYYTVMQIQRNFYEYFKNPNREIIEELKNKILKPLYNTSLIRACHMLSRAMFRYFEDKNWCMYYGSRNCGKGVFDDLMKLSFEHYVSSFNLNNILVTKKGNIDLNESSRKSYWLLDLEFVRLTISQETPKQETEEIDTNNNTNLILNGTMIKSICSGGDEQTARRNFDRFDAKFSIDAMLMIMGNFPIDVNPRDAFEHCISFESTTQFKTQEQYDLEESKELGEEYMSAYAVADPDIKSKCLNEDWGNAMVYLLYESFKPNPVLPNPISFMTDGRNATKSLREQIMDKFIITKNSKDRLLTTDVYKLFSKVVPELLKTQLFSFGVKMVEITSGPQSGQHRFIGIKPKKEVIEECEEYFEDALYEKIIITNNCDDTVLVNDINNLFPDYKPITISTQLTSLNIHKKKITTNINRNKWEYVGLKLKEI
jgi:hypothetical protein